MHVADVSEKPDSINKRLFGCKENNLLGRSTVYFLPVIYNVTFITHSVQDVLTQALLRYSHKILVHNTICLISQRAQVFR